MNYKSTDANHFWFSSAILFVIFATSSAYAQRIVRPGGERPFPRQVDSGADCVPAPASMVAWWPLDERQGTEVDDLRGASKGVAKPGPIGANGPAPDVTSAIGGALRFDGVDDVIEVAQRPGIDVGSGDFSLQMWMRADSQPGVVTVLD